MIIKYLDLNAINDSYGQPIIDAANSVIKSGWYLHGSETEAFEREYGFRIGNEYKVNMVAPFKHVMAGSINMNLDWLIDKLISDGVLTDNFDYMSSYKIIRDELIKSTEFRTSSLTSWSPFGFDDEPISYSDDTLEKDNIKK